MTPQHAIAMLDRSLAKNGQTVVLRRGTAAAPVAQATVKAHVRGYDPDELVSGITQKDSKVILSPTGLEGWPEGMLKEKDWIQIDGRWRTIVAAVPVRMADILVRIELQVEG